MNKKPLYFCYDRRKMLMTVPDTPLNDAYHVGSFFKGNDNG